MSRKPPPFFTFSISHQTYTTNFTLEYHNNIIQKRSHTMMINYPRKRLKIMKMVVSWKKSLFEDITHDDDQLSTKTTQDHEDDGIMETEEDFEE